MNSNETNSTLVGVTVQLGPGHPASFGEIDVGGLVTRSTFTFPFWSDGNVPSPVTSTFTTFWPGAILPPLFVQTDVTSPFAIAVTSTGALPAPLSFAQTRSCTAEGTGHEANGAERDVFVLAEVDVVTLAESAKALGVGVTLVTLPELVVILLIPMPAKAIVTAKRNTASTDRMVTHFLRIEFLAFI